MIQGNFHDKARATGFGRVAIHDTLAFQGNGATQYLLNQIVDNAQPQAAATFAQVSGKKRIKDFVPVTERYAIAIVTDDDQDVFRGFLGCFGLDQDYPLLAPFEGMDKGVAHQIVQNLAERSGVTVHLDEWINLVA